MCCSVCMRVRVRTSGLTGPRCWGGEVANCDLSSTSAVPRLLPIVIGRWVSEHADWTTYILRNYNWTQQTVSPSDMQASIASCVSHEQLLRTPRARCAILSQVRNALTRLRRTLVTILPPSAPNESVRWLSFRYVTNLISSHSRHSSRHAILPMQTLASPLPSCCATPSKINTLKPYAALAATSGTCGCPQPLYYPIRCGRGLANSFDALPWRLRAPTTRRPLTTTVVQRRTGCRPSVVA